MDALPYYKWHWRDWRANRRVQRMPWQAKGLYRELLDEFWAEGSLPISLDELADICGCSLDEFNQWWPHISGSWEERDGRLYNAKMDQQRTAKDAERVAKSDSGRAGGLKSNSQTRAAHNEANAKHLLGTAKHVQAQPDIAEQSRAEHKQEHEQEQSKRAPAEILAMPERSYQSIAHEIVCAHPKAIAKSFGPLDVTHAQLTAVLEAVQAECAASGCVPQIAEEMMLTLTRDIADAVKEWPPGEQPRVVKDVVSFFRERDYRRPIEQWRYHGGKRNRSQERSDRNLDALRRAGGLS